MSAQQDPVSALIASLDGPAVPPPVLCAVCRTPMNPALAEAGKRAHPNCDPEGETQP